MKRDPNELFAAVQTGGGIRGDQEHDTESGHTAADHNNADTAKAHARTAESADHDDTLPQIGSVDDDRTVGETVSADMQGSVETTPDI